MLGPPDRQEPGRQPPPVIREADFSGLSYLSLEMSAQTMNGHLHWYPVSQRVDLSFVPMKSNYPGVPQSGDGWRRDSDDRSHHEKRARALGAETLFSDGAFGESVLGGEWS